MCGSLRDAMIVSYRLMKATVLFGIPSAKMARICQIPGRKPAASIWLMEMRQVVIKLQLVT